MPPGYRGRTVGEIDKAGLRIVVHQSALNHVLTYSETDKIRELGGVLVGQVRDHDGSYVEISGFVEAVSARSKVASVMFTHDTWVDLNRKVEERFPSQRIVGWQHTHPDLGSFLSGYDLFIHRHFFPQPWQVALVVDPLRQEFVFFHWCGASIVDCGFYLVTRTDNG